MRISDWSSDVCSSDLIDPMIQHLEHGSLHSRFTQGKQSGSDQAHVGNGRISDQPLYITLPEGDNRGVYNPNDGQYDNDISPLDCCCGYNRKDPANDPVDPHLQHNSRQRSEEHTSELQSLMRISYAVFCLKKKKQ